MKPISATLLFAFMACAFVISPSLADKDEKNPTFVEDVLTAGAKAGINNIAEKAKEDKNVITRAVIDKVADVAEDKAADTISRLVRKKRSPDNSGDQETSANRQGLVRRVFSKLSSTINRFNPLSKSAPTQTQTQVKAVEPAQDQVQTSNPAQAQAQDQKKTQTSPPSTADVAPKTPETSEKRKSRELSVAASQEVKEGAEDRMGSGTKKQETNGQDKAAEVKQGQDAEQVDGDDSSDEEDDEDPEDPIFRKEDSETEDSETEDSEKEEEGEENDEEDIDYNKGEEKRANGGDKKSSKFIRGHGITSE